MDNYGMQNDLQPEIPMTMGQWLITIIVQAIPCVGIIMLFVWAFGQGNVSRRNYCRAMLIISAVGLVLGIIIYVAFAAVLLNAINSYSYLY
ncbi:hypothetical protein HNQ56_003330 [Anaerotaenia torta]|uniref:hypothetical protein n=1 Tax=Anaerotaenia torta TaxID=433293 RepID=UPI003D23B6C5